MNPDFSCRDLDDAQLDALLGGELEHAAALRAEEHLAGCPACRARHEMRAALRSPIRAASPSLSFAAPAGLRASIRIRLREAEAPRPRFAFLRRLLARPGTWAPPLGAALALLASHLVDVPSSDRHTVKPWFAGKLDYSPTVVDTAAEGYPLAGGRLDVLDGRTVAALVYHRRQHAINLFVWPADAGAVRRPLGGRDGFHVLGWSDGGMNYLAVSDLARDEFVAFADLIREG
ncbi:MAG TPA: anti-sigma factor, partial [Candidatus Methylacidiphilales bacterium]